MPDPAHNGLSPRRISGSPSPTTTSSRSSPGTHTGHLGRISPVPIPISIPAARGAKAQARRDVSDDGGGALLARGGDDLHRLLKHLRRAGAELPQGAFQVRGGVPREGPLLRRQVGGWKAGEAE
jgi:hypothetical protein